MKPYVTMLKTELKLSLRGMDMLIFAICMPLLLLVILGLIYGDAPAYSGAAYSFLEQSLGALASISICAGGVMGLPLVISDYRGKGILKRFQVTPVSPALLLFVQISIYALYAVVSLLSLLLAGFLLFGMRFTGNPYWFAGSYLLVMLSIFSIGMLVGGVAKDGKTAGAIASLLYFPMLIFSGATLPYEVMPTALQRVADVLPLTLGIKLLKSASTGLPAENALVPLLMTAVLLILCVFCSLKFFRWD